jgi:hypothetical protein
VLDHKRIKGDDNRITGVAVLDDKRTNRVVVLDHKWIKGDDNRITGWQYSMTTGAQGGSIH